MAWARQPVVVPNSRTGRGILRRQPAYRSG